MDTETNDAEKKVCEICKLSDTNQYEYGEWKTSEGYTVHYFCALLSSDAKQNGADNEGIYGFLPDDLREMCKSYTKTKCAYCPNKRATIKCCEPNCNNRFHMVCGMKNGCLNEFQDPFKSFCAKHVRIEEKDYKHTPDSNCLICTEALGEYDALTSIPACCDYKDHNEHYIDYYHKACMQEYAVKFGSLTKCSSCGQNEEGYQQFLRLRGIFVPEKDADYELSKDAFQSLLYKHKNCDADECHCPKGRGYIRSKGEWKYYRCVYCGGAGTHDKCRDDGLSGAFACRACTEKQSQSQQTQNNLSNNNCNDASEMKIDLIENVCKRKHKFDAEGAGKVWKVVHTNKDFRNTAYELMNQSDQPVVDLPKQNRKLREDRLKMFFENSDFNSKPRPPAWIV